MSTLTRLSLQWMALYLFSTSAWALDFADSDLAFTIPLPNLGVISLPKKDTSRLIIAGDNWICTMEKVGVTLSRIDGKKDILGKLGKTWIRDEVPTKNVRIFCYWEPGVSAQVYVAHIELVLKDSILVVTTSNPQQDLVDAWIKIVIDRIKSTDAHRTDPPPPPSK